VGIIGRAQGERGDGDYSSLLSTLPQNMYRLHWDMHLPVQSKGYQGCLP
jgi:hypothetical protein